MLRAVALLHLCQLGMAHLMSPTAEPVTEISYHNFTTNVFDMISESDMDSLFEEFSLVTILLDNSTDSGLVSYIDEILRFVRDGVCPKKGRCSNLLGCSCDKSFRKLGSQCKDLPCQIMEHVYDNAARAFEDLSEVITIEGWMRWISDHIFPALRLLCPCSRGMVNAAAMCALRYDADFAGPGISAAVRESAAALDMQNIRASLRALIGIFCANDGNCIAEFGDMLTEHGAMFDRTLNPDYPEECESYRRLSDVIMQNSYMVNDYIMNFTNHINFGHRIAEEFWCGNEKCSRHLDSTFNTCCSRVVHEKLNMKTLEAMLKASESILMEFVKSGYFRFGNLDRETKNKIMESINPRRMCWKQYTKKACA